MYATSFQTWGNSQGIRVSKPVLDQAGIAVGDPVLVSAKAGTIVIRRQKSKKFKLEDLVKQIPADYKPEELDWGPPVGKEVW